MRDIDLDYGQAIVLNYRVKYKMIIRKEKDNKYYLVNPIDLNKYCFNFTGTFILINYLEGYSMESIATVLSAKLNVIEEQIKDWTIEFGYYLRNIGLIS